MKRTGLRPVRTAGKFLLPIAAFALVGCGGGGGTSTGTTSTTGSTSTVSLDTTRSMDTATTTALDTNATSVTTTDATEGAALSTGTVTDVDSSNALLTSTTAYLGVATKAQNLSRAVVSGSTTYSQAIDGVTVTLTLTPTSLTAATFTITLNGSPTGSSVTYSKFVWASGTATRGTDASNSKTGTHYIVTYNSLRDGTSGTSVTLATGDYWAYTDTNAAGSLTFAASGTTSAWTVDTASNWDWSLYQNGSATTGKLRGQVMVKADHSGTAKLFCTTDSQVRTLATWTGSNTGQFCVYVTACSPNASRPCRAYP